MPKVPKIAEIGSGDKVILPDLPLRASEWRNFQCLAILAMLAMSKSRSSLLYLYVNRDTTE
jgi:hypothetical protein